ncbi:P-loop containing nucleoside triphosphate hydrolase protein [Gorgonomyces haynaldii]|nr:P-loop containing nucleoside triphosphate hydrolase protein [Gorgonomyces haynaldii]
MGDWADEPAPLETISLKDLKGGLDEGEKEVVVQLAEGTTLYESLEKFEDLGLSPELLKGVYGMGFQRPSKIQAKALPLLLANPPKNMIGQSQSGTGKTAAFVLSMLTRVDPSKPVVQGTRFYMSIVSCTSA